MNRNPKIYDFNPRWLNLKDAAKYSAIGEKRLKALADAEDIVGFQDPDTGQGSWVFDRLSIDEYREKQAGGYHKKALAILETVSL